MARRGIGRAMTAETLNAAKRSGARRAGLDATNAGLSIYVRLGFEIVTKMTRFHCTASSTWSGVRRPVRMARSSGRFVRANS
jgi:hypothetical protein